MPPTGNVITVEEFNFESDFKRATDLLINSSQVNRQINKKELGASIFANVPPDVLLEYVVKLIMHVHDGKKYRNYTLKNGLKLHHVVVQCFLVWLFALRKKNESTKASKNNLKAGEVDEESIDGESLETDAMCPFEFSNECKLDFVKEIAMHDFPPRTLNFAAKVLGISPAEIIKVVKTLSDEGLANSASILSLVSESVFNTLPLWDDILQQCLLLNPTVTSTQIESFAAPLSEEKREKVRKILLEIESKWMESSETHTQKFNEVTHRFGKPDPAFDVFRNNMIQLMKDLRQQTPDSKSVDIKSAMGLFRVTCDRFRRKEVNEEQLLDLTYNILKAKAQTRQKILTFLEKDQSLKVYAERIRKFNPIRQEVPANFEMVQIVGPRDNFLAIPVEIVVKHVTSPKQLQVIKFDLSKWEGSDYPYVGLDAEWSPYLLRSKASILQLALRDIVYIIDMDACSGSQQLADFLNYLFGNEKLIKLGFGFKEDLHQLRGCSPNCQSLFAPTKLVCAQMLFDDLVKLTKKEVGSLDGFLKPSNLVFEANPEIEQLEKELADPDFVEENPFRTPAMKESLLKDLIERDKMKKSELNSGIAQKEIKYMGLSAVCARVLGKCLDKSEQCSVWDRRPLRPSQVRYAALDAYCLLMLMDRFIDWSKQKNLNLKQLIESQPPVKIAFPLFFHM